MDGTFNTDVIQYGQGIHPSNLIETISPQLANHLREIGVIPQKGQKNKSTLRKTLSSGEKKGKNFFPKWLQNPSWLWHWDRKK